MKTVHELEIGDLLTRTDGTGGVVIRRIWRQVKKQLNCLDYVRVGFTVLDTVSLTDREVSIDEMTRGLTENSLAWYEPPVVREVKALHAGAKRTSKPKQ